MKLLYDHQIFTQQIYGGISRYFCELMGQFTQNSYLNFTIALRVSYNENLCNRHSLTQYWSNRNQLLSGNRIIPYILKTTRINFLSGLRINQSESIQLLKKQDFDIFHPTYYNPYFLKHLQGKPYILTVYDMIHELFPSHFSSNDVTVHWKTELIKHADKIIAISENTKKDIIKFSNVESDRISVIYLGNPFEFIVDCNKPSIQPSISSYQKPYLLFVGQRGGYKNFIFFISAISELINKDNDLHVYCAGGGPFTSNELKILKKLDIISNVHIVNINDHIMPQLYANARAFILPSLYEGFGLPILEAFSCGCPVIASNTSSLPEIGGDAACYFDPHDCTSFIRALESVINNEKLRNSYIKKGLRRVNEFSWKKTAYQTKTVYDQVLNQS